MVATKNSSELNLLLKNVDEAFVRKAWHGPNLRGSIRGVSAAAANWRPGKKRHNIYEIVVHAAYWKYAVRRRLEASKRGSFPLKGSNWFASPESLSQEVWREAVKLLEDEHRKMRETIARISVAQMHAAAPGSKVSNDTLIYGIAAHDVYHAGQIQLLKRLYEESASPSGANLNRHGREGQNEKN